MQTFPSVTKAEWLAKVTKDLRGKPLEELDFTVGEKTLSPFHHAEDLRCPPAPLKSEPGWQIGAHIGVQDVTKANKRALAALKGGAQFLWFSRYSPMDAAQKKVLLNGIHLEMIDHYVDEHEINRGRGKPALDLYHASLQADVSPVFYVWPPTENFFETVALLRAIRLCWQLVREQTNGSVKCTIRVFLPRREKEPNMNHIVNAVSATAAVIGGADVLFIPSAADHKEENDFYRRIAGNIHHLLIEEARLGKVADPAAGSYYIETLTDHYASNLWAEFQALHAKDQ